MTPSGVTLILSSAKPAPVTPVTFRAPLLVPVAASSTLTAVCEVLITYTSLLSELHARPREVLAVPAVRKVRLPGARLQSGCKSMFVFTVVTRMVKLVSDQSAGVALVAAPRIRQLVLA